MIVPSHTNTRLHIFPGATQAELLADAYRGAALAGENMLDVAEALETIRAALSEKDEFDSWRTIDDQIGRAQSPYFEQFLLGFRARFVAAVVDGHRQHVQSLAASDPAAAYAAWLALCAEALAAWRIEHLEVLSSFELSPCGDAQMSSEEVRRNALLVRRARWLEAHRWVTGLAKYAPSPVTRARLIVIDATIWLYRLRNFRAAKQRLEEASALAADEPEVINGWGLLAHESEDQAKAMERARKQIACAPHDGTGYLLLGRVLMDQGDLSAAEHQFRQAVDNSPGTISGYRGLIELYNRKERYESRVSDIEQLRDAWLKISPEDVASASIEIAVHHRDNGRFAEARALLRQVLEIDAEQTVALAQLGWCDFVEARNAADSAKSTRQALQRSAYEHFGRWLAAAPGDPEAYLALAKTAGILGDLDGAVMHLRRCEELRGTDVAVLCKNEEAMIYCEAEELSRAKVCAELALEYDQGNRDTINLLWRLGDKLLFDTNDDVGSRALYERACAEAGGVDDYLFKNRMGNLHYYQSNYEAAADCYRLAIKARAGDPVLHSNLATALGEMPMSPERARHLDEMILALKNAIALKPGTFQYLERLRKAEAERDILIRYDHESIQWVPNAALIRVDLDPSILPAFLDPAGNQLNSECQGQTEGMRKRIQVRSGVILPGVLYGRLAQGEQPGTIVIRVGVDPSTTKRLVRAGADVVAETLGVVEDVVGQRISCFVTFDGVGGLLQAVQDPVLSEVARSSRRLAMLVQLCRHVARSGANISSELKALAARVKESKEPDTTQTASWRGARSVAPRAQVTVGPDLVRSTIEAHVASDRRPMFDATGVILPPISWASGPEFGLKLTIDGEEMTVDLSVADGLRKPNSPPLERAAALAAKVLDIAERKKLSAAVVTHWQRAEAGERTRDALRPIAVGLLDALDASSAEHAVIDRGFAHDRSLLAAEALEAALRVEAYRFVSEELVDHHLTLLESDNSRLVTAARSLLSPRVLTAELAKRVRFGQSLGAMVLSTHEIILEKVDAFGPVPETWTGAERVAL